VAKFFYVIAIQADGSEVVADKATDYAAAVRKAAALGTGHYATSVARAYPPKH
jgi:hypothetical protein